VPTCFNAGMTQFGVGTGILTEVPTLQIEAELGELVKISELKDYIYALHVLSREALHAAFGAYRDDLARRYSGGRSELVVQRLRLGSPLDIVLSAAKDLTPIAYAASAMLIIERAVKLLMEWQQHTREMRRGSERMSMDFAVQHAVETMQRGDPSGFNRALAETALEVIVRYPIIRLETDADRHLDPRTRSVVDRPAEAGGERGMSKGQPLATQGLGDDFAPDSPQE
jgi:hypothetical protein